MERNVPYQTVRLCSLCSWSKQHPQLCIFSALPPPSPTPAALTSPFYISRLAATRGFNDWMALDHCWAFISWQRPSGVKAAHFICSSSILPILRSLSCLVNRYSLTRGNQANEKVFISTLWLVASFTFLVQRSFDKTAVQKAHCAGDRKRQNQRFPLLNADISLDSIVTTTRLKAISQLSQTHIPVEFEWGPHGE